MLALAARAASSPRRAFSLSIGTGEGTRLVVAIDAGGDARLTVTMATRAAQRLGATVGCAVTLGIDPDAVHLIVEEDPAAVRSPAAPREPQ